MSTALDEAQICLETYTLCCCCMELPCLKSLWSEYKWMGHSEVYGHMLKECFDLHWPQNEGSKLQICEVCITQLRSALQFKERVMQSQARLRKRLTDFRMPIKEETLDLVYATKDPLSIPSKVTDAEILLPDEKNIETARDDDDQDICDETVYNYDACVDEANSITKSELLDNEVIEENLTCSTVKQVRKKRKRRIIIIPKDKKRTKIEFRKVNYIKPRQNVCLILEHSTIVPFKSSKGYFTCLYCNKQHIGFDELKTHIAECHDNIRFKDIIKSILRPHDRVKADVSDIVCKICNKKLDNLEILITHLTEHHKVKFNFDSIRKPIDSIVPYDLSGGKYTCYICKTEFLFFKTLSNHMNTHSNDYVCDICGRCFLLPERLRAHTQLHIDGKSVKCDFCEKVCASTIILRSHIRYNHQKLSFMCSICNETFPTYRLRMRHLENVHNRALNLTCKVCSKKYMTPNSLNSHMRKEHLRIPKEPKYSCNVCGMMFKYPNALACHSIVHSGEKKFECEVCHKKYARAKSLTEHLKIHRNDRRWLCGACGQAFVQKCSLKNHIRVHHIDSDYEQLIVYKKSDIE